MALRFEAEATSLVGIQWRIRIYDSAYGGATVIPFKVGGDIFELAYDGADDDRVQYIIPSQLQFTYIIEGAAQEELIDNLKTAKEGRYLLEVEYLDTTYQPYWRGVLFADQVEVADEYYPQQVRLTASDDLKALDAIPYKVSDTVPYTGLSSLGSHLVNCINKVRWISLNSGTRTTFEDFFRSTQQATPVVTAATAIAIEHHGLYTISDNGNAEYPSTYEVLAEIMSLMGLRIFQVNGAFMTQSIFACEADVANAKLTPIDSTSVGATSTVARTTFSPGANYVKERGWMHGYLNPLSEVNRKYNFTGVIYYGYIQIYNSGADLLTGSTETLSTFADNAFQQNDIASLRFRLRLAWAGNGVLSGDNRLVRHKIILTWKMGQYYLARTAVINSSNLTEYPVPGVGQPTASVVNYEYNAPSWSTSSANRVEFLTPPLNMLASGSWEGEFGIEGPPFAADLSNSTSTVAFDMVAVLSTGSTSTAYDSQFTSVSNTWQRQQVLFVQLLPGDTTSIEGQTATYRVINDDDNGRAVLELPETRIGDKLAENQNHLLKALDGSAAYVPTETWYTDDDATTRSIHRLHCYEMLSGQNRTVPTQFGTLHERPATTVPGIRMHHLFVDDAQYYGIFHFTYSAYMNTYDIAVWKLDRELTNMSVPDVEFFGDPTGPTWGPGGGLPAAQIEALQVADTVTDATVGVIDTKLGIVFETVRPKSSSYATTSITYEAGQTDGMVIEIEQQTVQLKSASGNSYYSLTESSPGQMRFVLQDDATPTPNSVNCMQIDAASNTGKVGINQPAPAHALDVVGNIAVTGTVDGRDVATDGAKLDGIAAGAEVNQNAFTTIAVTGQSDVVADSKTDTLTLAAANTNLTITTNATSDTVTLGVASDLLLTSISTTGNVFALGSITGNNLTIGNVSSSGDITANSATLGNLYFTGGGTSTIGPNNSLPTDPADLEIRTNGNCDVVLDYDNNESSQAFRVKDGAGSVMFSVNEDGISVANGTSSTGAVLRLGEATANGTNYVGIQAPASLAANTTYTLPTADGTSGQVLSTNGSGTLSFVTRKATQVTGKTVATGAWSLVSGFYEATISDAAISATSIVDVIPDNGSAATAATAGVLPRTDSSSGAVKIYATATPAATLTVTLNIFDL